jgi:hypothetical protein
MANRRANFQQSDVTKVLKAFRDVGQPMPKIIIEPMRMTVMPMNDESEDGTPNQWDAQ